MTCSFGRVARLASGLLLAACAGSSAGPEGATGGTSGDAADAVYARLRNDTKYDFTGVGVAGVAFGPLRAGQLSEYQKVGDGSLYEFEGGFADTAELRFFGQITDHVGDRPLPHGRYTYGIAVTPDASIQDTDGGVFFSVR